MARGAASVVALVPVLALLAGCVSTDVAGDPAAPGSVYPLDIPPTSVALETRTMFPEGSALLQRADSAVTAHWVAGRRQFTVVIVGSSTCTLTPISTGALDESTVSVTFVPSYSAHPDHACTADAQPTAYFFSTPPSLADGDVTLAVTFDEFGIARTERIPITS